MNNIAVLLNGGINNDSRVINIIKTFSSINNTFIDLFYIEETKNDKTIFSSNVRLFCVKENENFKTKIIRHSFFYNEFMFYVPFVLKTGIQYNFIYANDLPCLKPAIKLKSKLRAKVIYDSHEIYNETINQFFPKNSKGIKKIIFMFLIFFMRYVGGKAENKFLKKIDSFITVGEALKLYFEKKYNVKNILIIKNLPLNQNDLTPLNLHELMKLDSTDFIIIYQGVLNQGRGLFLMIEALKYTNSKVKLLILGNGTLKGSLLDFVKANNLSDKVFFLDRVDSNVLLRYTKGADCGILLLESINLSTKYAAANKLFEYINAGIPVIANKSFEHDIVFEKYAIGLLVENNIKSIADAMNTMSISNNSKYKENSLKAVREYNWKNQESILINLIK